MHSETSGKVVKHEVIAAALRAQIKRGDFADRLPSRGDLTRSFGVAFTTIDKALCSLRKERVIQLRNGVGVFVHPRLRDQAVGECYFVFPGHKALTDATNESRQMTLHVLEELLTAAHALHAEVKLLPISPLNDGEINWTILTHLKRDDYVVFLGLQYWNVIEALAKKGCRCLVLSGHPATNELDAGGMSLMSFDVDYADMMDRVAEYFAGLGCRHLTVVGPAQHFVGKSWMLLFERLSRECANRGMRFSVRDVAGVFMSAARQAACGTPALGRKPPVDGIFTMTNEVACEVRGVLDRDFASVSRSIPLVCFDIHHTWQRNTLAIDALCKPQADMARRLMEVVCGKQPFESKDVTFPFRLETADGRR